ncbi:MAG: hypothetical protein AAF564_16650 [Bacteroidota bacterium]
MRYPKSILLLAAFALLVSACSVPANLPEGFDAEIPKGANRVDLISDKSVEDLFNDLQQWLPAQGFAIEDANEVTRTIETGVTDIGQRSTMKIKLRINPYERGAKMEAIGTWSSDVEEATYASASENVSSEEVDWWPATWEGENRASYAYARLINAFYDMPATEKRYVKQ